MKTSNRRWLGAVIIAVSVAGAAVAIGLGVPMYSFHAPPAGTPDMASFSATNRMGCGEFYVGEAHRPLVIPSVTAAVGTVLLLAPRGRKKSPRVPPLLTK